MSTCSFFAISGSQTEALSGPQCNHCPGVEGAGILRIFFTSFFYLHWEWASSLSSIFQSWHDTEKLAQLHNSHKQQEEGMCDTPFNEEIQKK